MNLLTDTLPETIKVGDIDYPIDTDYRAALRIMLAFEDNELADQEKQIIVLANLFTEHVPDDLDAALTAATWYLNCGETPKQADDGQRLFSFSKDARFIFAAFRQTHDIDLETAQLHWWKFQALFMDLGAETTFCNLVGLRKRHYAGKTTKEERAAIADMGDLFDVPKVDDLTLEEMDAIAEFDRRIAEGIANREKAKQAQQT